VADTDRYVSLTPYTVTDPKSPSPICFWGLSDSFLGGLSYTTRLSFTSIPIFGVAWEGDFSNSADLYLPLTDASNSPISGDDKTPQFFSMTGECPAHRHEHY
jgi:hypothetical protein